VSREPFRPLLLAVWQEVCRHTEIGESTATITDMLASDMPIHAVLVCEVDVKRSRLMTVAVSAPGPRVVVGGTQPSEWSPGQIGRLLAWCRHAEPAHHRPQSTSDDPWGPCLPSEIPSEAIVGPLPDGQGRHAVLVVLAPPRQRFEARHVLLVRALLEPFAVALANHHRLRELQTLRETAEAEKQSLLTRLGRTQVGETIMGAEAGLRAVMERVELVARADVPVLILGETGTGKELIARAIHSRSPHSSGPFIRVNCGAIPPDLIDAQLFGHERGSFTGAVDTRKGWFERADGGTLFLDEIGELLPAAQVRLLRVLQDGSLERIGGKATIKVDTRIVAATHRDLTAMIAAGRFREDLWYRIAVFPVALPTLRERPEDIPALARHFAERAAVRFGLPVQMPSTQDIGLLVAYPWPGNVRELAAVIDRAAILGNGERLEIAKALGAGGSSVVPPVRPVEGVAVIANGPGEVAPLDTAVRRHIETALAATCGRIEGRHGAAALLRVNPHTLRARMRKLRIEWGRFRSPA
jgi:transcriptional regulator with GAF, ATPase, and Fis domain